MLRVRTGCTNLVLFGLLTHDGARWHLVGHLEFCSGVGLFDVAFVDAQTDAGRRQLFLVPLRTGGVIGKATHWTTSALAATATGRVDIDVTVTRDAAIGPPGFDLERSGIWHGSIGVAACWAGGARGVHRGAVMSVVRDNPHALAAFGQSEATCWGMQAVLERAARTIDERPGDVGMAVALTVRHLIVDGCQTVIAASERATGPGPLVFDRAHTQRVADLRLYIQQHHYDTDLATIGAAAPLAES